MITKEQFMRYYKVQMEGRYNMLDRRAIALTGIDDKTYLGIIRNYNELHNKYIG